MDYRAIIKQLADKENVSSKEIEKEMEAAIKLSGISCSSKELIEIITLTLLKRLYIV